MIAYRISSPEYIRDLSGEGSRIYGGRWNLKGNACLYMASSISLAFLEKLVHLPIQQMPNDLKLAHIEIEDLPKKFNRYPKGWDTLNPNVFTQEWGTKQLLQHKGIFVPSVVIQGEFNILHRPISKLKITRVVDFKIDERIQRLFSNR